MSDEIIGMKKPAFLVTAVLGAVALAGLVLAILGYRGANEARELTEHQVEYLRTSVMPAEMDKVRKAAEIADAAMEMRIRDLEAENANVKKELAAFRGAMESQAQRITAAAEAHVKHEVELPSRDLKAQQDADTKALRRETEEGDRKIRGEVEGIRQNLDRRLGVIERRL